MRLAAMAAIVACVAGCKREIPELVEAAELATLERGLRADLAARRAATCEREAFGEPVPGVAATLDDLLGERFAPCAAEIRDAEMAGAEAPPGDRKWLDACDGVDDVVLTLAAATRGCSPRFVGHPQLMGPSLALLRAGTAARWQARETADRGDASRAIDLLLAAIRVGDDVSRRAPLVTAMLGSAIADRATRDLEGLVHELDAAARQRLDARLAQLLREQPSFAGILTEEYSFYRATYLAPNALARFVPPPGLESSSGRVSWSRLVAIEWQVAEKNIDAHLSRCDGALADCVRYLEALDEEGPDGEAFETLARRYGRRGLDTVADLRRQTETLAAARLESYAARFARYARKLGGQRARLAMLRLAIATRENGCAAPEAAEIEALTSPVGGDYRITTAGGTVRVDPPAIFEMQGEPPRALELRCL